MTEQEIKEEELYECQECGDMTPEEKQLLQEIRNHLGKLHSDWDNDPEKDGYCKSNEGYVSLTYSLDNWFECDSDIEKYKSAEPKLAMVEVYSYLFGPSRLHTFYSIEDAHKAVLSW